MTPEQGKKMQDQERENKEFERRWIFPAWVAMCTIGSLIIVAAICGAIIKNYHYITATGLWISAVSILLFVLCFIGARSYFNRHPN